MSPPIKNPDPLEQAMSDLERVNIALEQVTGELDRLAGQKRELESFVQLYQRYASMTRQPKQVVDSKIASAMSKRAQVVQAATDLITRKGPQTLAELFDHVKGLGIEMGTGSDEMQRGYLSSMIHKSRAFKLGHGRRWAIAGTESKGAPAGLPLALRN